jgi:hypothetical protein
MKIDKFHWHEAMDRVSIVQGIIEHTLSYHAVFIENPALESRVEAIHVSFHDLIQEIAELKEAYKFEEEEIEHTVGSGNFFKDLGFDNPEEEQYNANLKIVEQLMDLDPPADTPQGKRLIELANSCGEYEDKHFKFNKPSDEELAKFRAEQMRQE